MSFWLSFITYSASRPDTWLSVAGAVITIIGIVLQQHILSRLVQQAQQLGEEKAQQEERHRELRDRQREAADLVKMSEIEQLIIEVRRESGGATIAAPARLQGIIEACSTLFGACNQEDDAAIDTFYDRQQTFIDRAFANDPKLYTELMLVHNDVSLMANLQAADALHKAAIAGIEQAATEHKIQRVASLGAMLSAAGFVLVLVAGLLGAQLEDFAAMAR